MHKRNRLANNNMKMYRSNEKENHNVKQKFFFGSMNDYEMQNEIYSSF